MQYHRIVVAGGAGFIGTHLCARLLHEGNDVVCIDNLYSGRLENIRQFLDNPHFCFINHDVTKPVNLTDVSMIFNLACPASPKFYQKNAIFTTMTAVIGTANMLDLATKNNCPMLQASTSEVYGEPLVHPQSESYYGNVNPVGIRSCYDEGKRCAESLSMDYHRQHGTKVKIVRIFNTYGPYMRPDDGRVISNFIMQALHGKPITIHGDGSQTRCFMYIDDLIEGFLKIMDTPDDFTGPVNLGCPEEHTIKEIAEMVIKQTKSKSQITYLPLPLNDPTRRKPDISYVASLWEPEKQTIDGIKEIIKYQKYQLHK